MREEGVDYVKNEDRNFYVWLHNTLKIKQKKVKVHSHVNTSHADLIAEKIAKVEAEIAQSTMEYELAEFEIDERSMSKVSYESHKIKRDEQNDAYDLFDEMRKIGKGDSHQLHFDDFFTNQFYQQAIFMKDFEDNLEVAVSFEAFRPIYAYMNNQQLRSYFTWRTKMKNGLIENTSWSYVQVFIFELVNHVHGISLHQSVDLLIKLWTTYRTFNTKVDRFFESCIKDYYICNEFTCSYSEIESRFPVITRSQETEKEAILNKEYDGLLDYLNQLSSYKVSSSIFYSSSNGYLIHDCLATVLYDLDVYFAKYDIDFAQILIGKPVENTWWIPFRNAVYYKGNVEFNRTAVISRLESYECKQGKWKQIIYDGGSKYRKLVAFILKAIESKLRDITGFQYKLKPNVDSTITDYYMDKNLVAAIRDEEFINRIYQSIEIYVAKHNVKQIKINSNRLKSEEAKRELIVHKALEIQIDPSKFEKIREAADDIQEKLLVDEMEMVNDPIASKTYGKKDSICESSIGEHRGQSIWIQFVQVLTAAEVTLLETILAGKNSFEELSQVALKYSYMVEVLVESINEKAIESIGDNLIDGSDGAMCIYEDYVQDVLAVLRKEKY